MVFVSTKKRPNPYELKVKLLDDYYDFGEIVEGEKRYILDSRSVATRESPEPCLYLVELEDTGTLVLNDEASCYTNSCAKAERVYDRAVKMAKAGKDIQKIKDYLESMDDLEKPETVKYTIDER